MLLGAGARAGIRAGDDSSGLLVSRSNSEREGTSANAEANYPPPQPTPNSAPAPPLGNRSIVGAGQMGPGTDLLMQVLRGDQIPGT